MRDLTNREELVSYLMGVIGDVIRQQFYWEAPE